MIAAAWAVLTFCRSGNLSIFGHEPNAREHLALINGGSCGPDCTRQHLLVRWDGEA